jgi:hypothetical protein
MLVVLCGWIGINRCRVLARYRKFPRQVQLMQPHSRTSTSIERTSSAIDVPGPVITSTCARRRTPSRPGWRNTIRGRGFLA